MARLRSTPFNPKLFLTKVSSGKTQLTAGDNDLIFSQGDAANAVFYVQTGKVKLNVLSSERLVPRGQRGGCRDFGAW
jgi:CRP/FNR family cyclic AMP-dependent transcriptional regulator